MFWIEMSKTKRPPPAPKPIVIECQDWTVVRERYWMSMVGAGHSRTAWIFTRVSDGRTMTASNKERGAEVVAERIRTGVY